jgi:hypothetical protein
LFRFLSESLLMSNNNPSTFKAAMTVREVCQLVQLSTARFYELQAAGIFPMPVYDLRSRRPLFTEELQRLCVEIRQTGRGFNGLPVIFYSQRRLPTSQPKRATNAKATPSASPPDDLGGVLAAVRSLGLTAATAGQVESAVKQLFPGGTTSVEQGQVVRQVFVLLNRQRAG